MTRKLTREENVQAVFDLKAGYTLGLADVEILKRVARMALAAMDSEPNRNPVLAYADSYRDMEKQGVESVPIWSVITDLERNIAPLYRHAQQPVVPDDVQHVAAVLELIGSFEAADIDSDTVDLRFEIDDVDTGADASITEYSARGAAIIRLLAGNSPVIPEGYVMVPMRLTAENGAKCALSGEFSETKFINCPECFGDDECDTCDGSGRIEITVPVTWTTIKEIWVKGVEHFSAAPQEVKGE